MKKSEKQTNYAIKSKLVSAVAMLLVAAVMVVSSTYAWFTLSTAPEVKGVSTAVGANGALEMLLATLDGEGNWKYGTGSVGGLTTTQRNTYWGNLVDLSDTSYGSQAITLFPSKLNLNADGKLQLLNPLQVPLFGSDGRVESLTPDGAFAKYNGTNFVEDGSYYGFRGLGVASGLSERQQAFRTAISAMATASYNAQTEARKSLSANGTALANIAILKAMSSAEKPFVQADVDAINSMVNGLELALKQAEEAYIQAIIVYALGTSGGQADDLAATSLAAAIASAANSASAELNAKLTAVFSLLSTNDAIDVSAIQTAMLGYSTYERAVADVADAKEALANITPAEKYAWADISGALTSLVNVDGIKINNIPAAEVTQTANKNQIASDILGGKGVKVIIPSEGGVYADIADLSGDYTVDIEINSTNLNVGVDDLIIKASMTADSAQAKPYLTLISETLNAVSNQPGKAESGALPLTELYGYVIDLAFRTNAAQSNLLLQTDAIDRIYSENNNDATMGSGSTMTFKSSSADFTTAKVKSLMENIRVVFYSTIGESNMADVYATAKLDLVNGVVEDAKGVTAKLYLYKDATATKATISADGAADTVVYKYDGKYYSSTICTPATEITDLTGKTVTDSTETVTVEVRDNVITSLNQNEAKHVSALVYLDGENIENSDVAATVAQSMTGTVNFQFASSAELVPMEYGELHTMN